MANWVTVDFGFWREVFLKDQDHQSDRIPSKEGGAQANHRPPKRSKSQGRPSEQRTQAGGLEKMDRQNDIDFQADGQALTLSPKESRLVELIAAGYTNEDMAHLLSLSRSAIHRRTIRVMSKLGISSRLELIFFALSYGIISPPPQNPV